MANPYVIRGSDIIAPEPVPQYRNLYSRFYYSLERIFQYGEGMYDTSVYPGYPDAAFVPKEFGTRSYHFKSYTEAGVDRPGIVDYQTDWATSIERRSSAMLTANNTIMPSLMIPEINLVDNGFTPGTGAGYASHPLFASFHDDGDDKHLFNWQVYGYPVSSKYTFEELFNASHVNTGGVSGSRFCVYETPEYDAVHEPCDMAFQLQDPDPADRLGNMDNIDIGAGNAPAISSGAFAFTLFRKPRLVPKEQKVVSGFQNESWYIEIIKGALHIVIDQSGATAYFALDKGERTKLSVYAPGESDTTPYVKFMRGAMPITILVYPVWNGVIIAASPIDSKKPDIPFSTYVQFNTGKGKFQEDYMTPFDPSNPGVVQVASDSTVTPYLYGLPIIKFRNCGGGWAFQPVFFSPVAAFDEYVTINDPDADSELVSQEWTTWPIWSPNGTGYQLGRLADTSQLYTPGPTGYDDTAFQRYVWKLAVPLVPDPTDPWIPADNQTWRRTAPEIIGEIFQITEYRNYSYLNENGSFALDAANIGVTGPLDPNSPALDYLTYDSSDDWLPYVVSVNVTMNIDSTSGNMVIDKAGLFGQDAYPIQSVGSLSLEADVANWTSGYSGRIFAGIAMGVGDNMTIDGATINIPLVGLEKKLDDMALINVPFFDGYPACEALNFFCGYAGITPNYSYAPELLVLDVYGDYEVKLSYSQDVNVPRHEFKTGTNVRSAIDAICDDLALSYVVRDGQIFFHTLNEFGVPAHVRTAESGIPAGPWTGYDGYVIESLNRNPDFDDMRNLVTVIGLTTNVDSNREPIEQDLLMPTISVVDSDTYPSIPWMKPWVYPVPGYITPAFAAELATRLSYRTKIYEFIGGLTIPGNAAIRPYDVLTHQGVDYFIYSVSHTIDLHAKKWTTTVQLMQYVNPYEV